MSEQPEIESTEIFNLTLPNIKHEIPININWVKNDTDGLLSKTLAFSDDQMVAVARLQNNEGELIDEWAIMVKSPPASQIPPISFSVTGTENAKWVFAFNVFSVMQADYFDSVVESFSALKN